MQRHIHQKSGHFFKVTTGLLMLIFLASCKNNSKKTAQTPLSTPPDAQINQSPSRNQESITAVTPTPTPSPTPTPLPTASPQLGQPIGGSSVAQSPFRYAPRMQVQATKNATFSGTSVTPGEVVTGWDPAVTSQGALLSPTTTTTDAAPSTSATAPQVVQQDPFQMRAFTVQTPYSRWQVGQPFFTSEVKSYDETLAGYLFFASDKKAINGNSVSSYFNAGADSLHWHSLVSEANSIPASASIFPCQKSVVPDASDTVLGLFLQNNFSLHFSQFGVQLPSQMWSFSAQNRCTLQGSVVIPKGKFIKKFEHTLRASAYKDTGASGLVSAALNLFQNTLTLPVVNVTFAGNNQYSHGRPVEETAFADVPRNLQDWQCGYTHANALQTDFRLELNAAGSHIPFVNNFIMGANEDEVRYSLKPELANCL